VSRDFCFWFTPAGGKFAAGVVDTGGNLPPASLTQVANLPPVSLTLVSTTLAKMVEKFAAGVVDTATEQILISFLLKYFYF
jgi:hypothetical protein